MDWCAKHGVAQNWEQYIALPYPVIEHCRLVMRAEIVMKGDESQPTQDLLAGLH